jgi:signal transduction histidine kinase/CheY-like chemotaxis protein
MARQVVETGEAVRFQDERNGRFFLTSMSPIFGPDGSLVHVASFVRDITDLKRIEQEQRLAALGRLSAGVAHEFNNLMGALLLAGRMVKEPDASPGLRELVELIVRSAESGREISRNLLAFTKPCESSCKRVRVEEPIEAALQLCLPYVGKSHLRVEKDYQTEGWVVQGATTQLQQVFLNLVLNACQAMPDGGLIAISTRHEGDSAGADCVVVAVTDTGTGIAPDRLPHIFEPFYTTKGTLGIGADPGTGLGLSMCYGIIEHHSGTIEVSSTPGAGSVFTVRLPAVTAVPEITEAPSEATPARLPQLKARVLVAEDQPDMLKLLRRFMAAEGCEAVVTARTTEALEALETQRFDLVVSDYQMPDGGAPRLLAATRDLPVPPPVIVVTGSTDPAALEKLHEQGAAACLFKPFELDDLRQLMAKLLSS